MPYCRYMVADWNWCNNDIPSSLGMAIEAWLCNTAILRCSGTGSCCVFIQLISVFWYPTKQISTRHSIKLLMLRGSACYRRWERQWEARCMWRLLMHKIPMAWHGPDTLSGPCTLWAELFHHFLGLLCNWWWLSTWSWWLLLDNWEDRWRDKCQVRTNLQKSDKLFLLYSNVVPRVYLSRIGRHFWAHYAFYDYNPFL